MSSIRPGLKYLFRDRKFRGGVVLISGGLIGLFLIFLALQFQWIDYVEIGMSRGIDRIGEALAPLHLLIYGFLGSTTVGVTLILFALVAAFTNRAQQGGGLKGLQP